MSDTLLQYIENMLPYFSKAQKSIAQYVLKHYDKSAFMTASNLGNAVGVSESTVVRFATEIGYDGYPQFQKAMQELVRSKLTSLQRMEVTYNRLGNGNVLESVLQQDIEKIRKTIEETSREDFNASVDAIVRARKIYIFGVRSSASLASFLGYYFNLIFGNVTIVSSTSESEMFEHLFRVDNNDVVIGISFPRYSSMAVKAMTFARERGATVLALTDSIASPLAKAAHYVLLAKSDMASIVDSLVAPLSLINALIVATALKDKERVARVFEELEDIWEEYGVYEKLGEKKENGV